MGSDGQFTYQPLAGFVGTDSFTYTVDDGNGGQATATVSITVGESTAPPYYVEALIYGDPYRLNYGDPVGTATTVTFAFAEVPPDYYDPGSFAWDTFLSFSAGQRPTVRDVLEAISGYSSLTFVETGVEEAEMVFGIADLGYGGFAYAPSADGTGNTASDIWIDDGFAGSTFEPGSSAYKTLIHEIGHAIGLTHPSLPIEENSRKYTVMTAYPHPTMAQEPQTHMLYDVAAVQYLYRANTSHALGDDIYVFSGLNGVVQTIWDAGGHDTLNLSAASFGVTLDLRPGGFSTIDAQGSDNLAIAFGTLIEDAVGGAYDDRITGNELANVIIGGAGNDVLTGLAGPDTFVFESRWGDDTITDFSRGENLLDLSQAVASFTDLNISSSGGNTLITFRGDSILIVGVEAIEENAFIFA